VNPGDTASASVRNSPDPATTASTPLSRLLIERDPSAATVRPRRPWWRRGWIWLAAALVLVRWRGGLVAQRGRAVAVELGTVGRGYPSQAIAVLSANGPYCGRHPCVGVQQGHRTPGWLGVQEGQRVLKAT